MYARGMSVREIKGLIAESYGTQVSPDFISSITDEVMAETIAWQSRPLEPIYPVVFFSSVAGHKRLPIASYRESYCCVL